VVNEQTIAEARRRVDLDAGHGAVQMRDQPGDDPSAEALTIAVDVVGQPMKLDGVKARIAQDDFEVTASGRVSVTGGADVARYALN